MKKILMLIVLILPLSCKDNTPSKVLAPVAKVRKKAIEIPEEDPISAPFLWKVSNSKGESYLVGSLHLSVDAESIISDALYEKLFEARNVVFEADMKLLKSNPGRFAGRMQLPPEKSLRKMLSPKQWQTLREYLPLIPEPSLDRVKPWAAVSMLLSEAGNRLTKEPKRSMDESLHRFAELQSRQISFLESVEDSMKSIEVALTIEILVDALDHPEEIGEELKNLRKFYLEGNEEGLVQLIIKEESAAQKKMNRLLLYERNEKWMDHLVPILEKGNAFIVVGAGHLLGDKSLVAMLRKKGMKVERVKP